MSHMGWQVRCRAKLPSNTPSRAAQKFAAGATLQRICAALESRIDAAAAHRAHQSQTAPPLAGQMQSHRLVALHVARHCRFCRTRRNKIAFECFSSNAKTPTFSNRISRIALTSHVARLVLFTHHTSRAPSRCPRGTWFLVDFDTRGSGCNHMFTTTTTFHIYASASNGQSKQQNITLNLQQCVKCLPSVYPRVTPAAAHFACCFDILCGDDCCVLLLLRVVALLKHKPEAAHHASRTTHASPLTHPGLSSQSNFGAHRWLRIRWASPGVAVSSCRAAAACAACQLSASGSDRCATKRAKTNAALVQEAPRGPRCSSKRSNNLHHPTGRYPGKTAASGESEMR